MSLITKTMNITARLDARMSIVGFIALPDERYQAGVDIKLCDSENPSAEYEALIVSTDDRYAHEITSAESYLLTGDNAKVLQDKLRRRFGRQKLMLVICKIQ